MIKTLRESITSRVPRAFRFSYSVLLAAAAAGTQACEARLDVDAPAPAMMADADTLPTLPTSTLDIPLTLDLSPVVRELEKVVPRRFGDIDERKPVSNKRVHIAYEAVRNPFLVSLNGRTATIAAVVQYKGRGWYKPPIGPEISSSCGITDQMPRARILLASDLRITPEWQLRGNSKPVKVTPFTTERRDQCRVTVLKIDVTDKVIKATQEAIEKQRPMIDRKVSSINIRPRFENWWHLLEQPIRLTDSVWLLIKPSAVRMGENVGVKRTLVTALGFSASPVVVTGPKPQPTVTALPPLNPAAVGNGLHILLEGVIGYDLATDLLRKAIVGKTFTRAGQSLEIREARIFGIGGGKLALELRFKGAANGHVYLVGTPRYDAASNELYVPDLDYDVGSTALLVQGLEWVKHDDVRDFITKNARWPVGNVMQTAKEQLAKGLNRDLAPGVHLSAEVKQVEGLSVHARRTAIRLRAQADANARLTINQSK